MIDQIILLFNSNFFVGLITLIVGGFAIYLYFKKNSDAKRNAAKIILQEIRRAEDTINDYKEHGQYRFTKKIIATNSWAINIHHFVGELDQDELDKISNLYSTGEYLDSIITKVSDTMFKTNVKSFEENIKKVSNIVSDSQNTYGGQLQSGQQPSNIKSIVKLPIVMETPWKKLLDEITYKYEPIYHSTIAAKLKKIAKLKK